MAAAVDIAEADIATYERDGAVVLRGIVTPGELALLEAGVEEIHRAPGRRSSTVRTPDGLGETLVETFPGDRSPSLRALREGGRIAEIAGRMMRASSAQLVFEQIFYKRGGDIVPTPWHQDTPFLRVRGMDMARVWLSCDPSPADLTVQLVRGSHRWNIVYGVESDDNAKVRSEASDHYSNDDLGDRGHPPAPDVARHRDSFDILTFDIAPGDALVFQGNMLHGASGRAGHTTPRRAFTTMWGGPALRYHEPSGKAFPPPGDLKAHPVPHGAPIGEHEAVFPIGWRA